MEKIKEKVKKLKELYDFKGPLHFTDFSNLNSIISIGYMCSRNLCYANNIEFYDILHEDGTIPSKVKGCTRFYYVEKNNNEAMKQLSIPVYLLFSEELLYFDLAIYTDKSADFKDANFGIDFDFFNYEVDWNAVFSKRCSDECLNGEVGELFIKRKQSELLIDEPVSLKQLKNIIFRCNADYKRACYLFGKSKLYAVEPQMFLHHNNYVKDYNVVYSSSLDSDVFILHFCTNEPVKNHLKHEYRLYDLNDNLLRVAKVNFMESESTDFHVEVSSLPCLPVKFKLWLYGILSIEETIG